MSDPNEFASPPRNFKKFFVFSTFPVQYNNKDKQSDLTDLTSKTNRKFQTIIKLLN